VVGELKAIGEPLGCYEASCGYGRLYDQIRPLAAHVAVAHPGKLRLIYRSKRKNDRFDAEKLGKTVAARYGAAGSRSQAGRRANWRSLVLWRQR